MESEHAAIVTTATLDAARDYHQRGWAILPIPRGEKGPRITGWPDLRLGESDLPAYFGNGENIGAILGTPSHGIVDVDRDCSEAITVADYFLPETGCVFGRASKPRSHHFYICEPNNALSRPRPEKFCAPDGITLVEVRADGQQTVVPPSLHPSGEFYEFSKDGEPAVVSGDDLRRDVARVAAAALIARHWPAQGQRHEAAIALAGMLLRAQWLENEVRAFMSAVATASGDEELRDRMRAVPSTEARLAAGKTATGAPMLASIVGTGIVHQIRDWLGLFERATASSETGGWPEPMPIGEELLPVPAFDVRALPGCLRPLVEDVSERMQTPVDFAAAAAIVALAGSVNRRAIIRPKLVDSGWAVIPNLWGAIVAPPGMMKSPLLRAISSPLTSIEEKWRVEYENDKDGFLLEKEKGELRFQAWREDYKRAVKKGEQPPLTPDNSLHPPTQRRLLLTDATFEKLHEILAENPAGVLVVRDELTGWLSE